MKKALVFISSLLLSLFVHAQCDDLFISEYVEGSVNNKAIEIFNPTADTIDLTPYSIRRYRDGLGVLTEEHNLYGSIAPYDVFIIVNANATPPADSALQALADQLTYPWGYPTPLDMDGNDAIVLYNMNTLSFVDIFGHTNDASMQTEGGWGPLGGNRYWTKDHSLIRKHAVMQGVSVNPTPSFDPSLEWDSLPADVWENLGFHNCKCHVSIKENPKDLFDVSVFPNPTKGTITIACENMEQIEVIDITGKLLYNITVSKDVVATDISSFSKGVYFVKVFSADGIGVKRILLQ